MRLWSEPALGPAKYQGPWCRGAVAGPVEFAMAAPMTPWQSSLRDRYRPPTARNLRREDLMVWVAKTSPSACAGICWSRPSSGNAAQKTSVIRN